jgi:hypothetical protein
VVDIEMKDFGPSTKDEERHSRKEFHVKNSSQGDQNIGMNNVKI